MLVDARYLAQAATSLVGDEMSNSRSRSPANAPAARTSACRFQPRGFVCPLRATLAALKATALSDTCGMWIHRGTRLHHLAATPGGHPSARSASSSRLPSWVSPATKRQPGTVSLSFRELRSGPATPRGDGTMPGVQRACQCVRDQGGAVVNFRMSSSRVRCLMETAQTIVVAVIDKVRLRLYALAQALPLA